LSFPSYDTVLQISYRIRFSFWCLLLFFISIVCDIGVLLLFTPSASAWSVFSFAISKEANSSIQNGPYQVMRIAQRVAVRGEFNDQAKLSHNLRRYRDAFIERR
jgi:hypothetical protein